MGVQTSSRAGHSAMLLTLICSVSFFAAACGGGGSSSDPAPVATEQIDADVKGVPAGVPAAANAAPMRPDDLAQNESPGRSGSSGRNNSPGRNTSPGQSTPPAENPPSEQNQPPAQNPPPPADGNAITVRFAPSYEDFPNPERGYMGWAGDLTASGYSPIPEQVALGFRLLRAIVILDVRDRPLSDDFITRLGNGLARVRANGAKVVLRFVYNFPDDTSHAQDAPLSIIQTHLSQLAPVLRRDGDVIAFLEAGFVGAWGEWHSSTSGLETPEAQRPVRDAILAALPANRFALFRYPAALRTWSPQPVPLSRAFDGSAPARSGMHNDCFLSTPTDANTFPTQAHRDYAMAQARVAPVGGETCDFPPQRMTCRDILTEGRAYAFTYLNRYYVTPTYIARWQAEGCADEVARSFGYRFELVDATHALTARNGEAWTLSLTVRNVGWARLYNPRPLRVTLIHAVSGRTVSVDADQVDPRQWLPAPPPSTTPENVRVNATVRLPAGLEAGEWRVAIGLPDEDQRLTNDPRYAIRFANRDQPADGQRWDPVAGRFELGTRVRIGG